MSKREETPLGRGILRARSGRQAALIVVAVAVVALLVAAFLVVRSRSTTSQPDWPSLPDPTVTKVGEPQRGETLGQGGGRGDGVVTASAASGLGDRPLVYATTCQGQGMLVFTLAGRLAGSVQCFTGQSVQYEVTMPAQSVKASAVEVTASADLVWRMAISAQP